MIEQTMDELEDIHDIKAVKNFLMSFWKTIQKQNSFLFGHESLMFLA